MSSAAWLKTLDPDPVNGLVGQIRSTARLAGAQRGDESGVLRRGHAPIQRGVQGIKSVGIHRLGVEPETGEDLGLMDSILARRHRLEPPLAAYEPDDLVGIDPDEEVFEDIRAFVLIFLGTEVVNSARITNLDDSLGRGMWRRESGWTSPSIPNWVVT
jgi:hypothetical protein